MNHSSIEEELRRFAEVSQVVNRSIHLLDEIVDKVLRRTEKGIENKELLKKINDWYKAQQLYSAIEMMMRQNEFVDWVESLFVFVFMMLIVMLLTVVLYRCCKRKVKWL